MKKPWEIAEAKTAKRHGGKKTMASGSNWADKGDVVNEKYMIEVKSTISNSYSLKFDTLKKMRLDALKSGKLSYLVLDFVKQFGGRFVIIEENEFLNLLNE